MKDTLYYQNKLRCILSNEFTGQPDVDNETLIEFGYDAVEQGEYRRAFHLFSIGFRLQGNDPDLLNGMGITLCEMGKLKFSKNILLAAERKYPNHAITLANLAGVYWEECDYDRAIYFYTRALKCDPALIEVHFNIINLYYEKGDLFMAYISCLNLLTIDPDNEQAQELRDDIILNLGISLF